MMVDSDHLLDLYANSRTTLDSGEQQNVSHKTMQQTLYRARPEEGKTCKSQTCFGWCLRQLRIASHTWVQTLNVGFSAPIDGDYGLG